jgi:predicted nucleotidyltransferase
MVPLAMHLAKLKTGTFSITNQPSLLTLVVFIMTKKSEPKEKSLPGYWGADVPMSVIRRFARAVAERFHPDKIILFGSHAYGRPNADSDVDILVIMPAKNQLHQAYKICLAVPAPFPMDLIVRTPKNLEWRLREGESFHTEIISKGKVLYEKDNGRMGAKSRGRSPRRKARVSQQNARP